MAFVNRVVGGRFALERQAGAGGMARIFRACDLTTGETVALKLLHATGTDELRRFHREIAALAQLAHPSIVRYVAHGVEPATQEPYLALEWLDGVDLAQRLEAGPLPIEQTIVLGQVLATALSEAHGRGVIHRDLKPGNVFLVGGEPTRAKLLDFGLARSFETSAALTQTGALLGTPLYMAPEQARGERELDVRVDLHALGAVLFSCLVGAPPFVANNLIGLLAKIAVDLPPRVRERRPDVPEALDRLVARLLGKRREERPPHAGAVAEALAAIAAGTELAPSLTPSVWGREQRVVCVLLAAPSGDAVPVDARTLDATFAARGSSPLRLADGTLLVTFASPESPAELATRAVRSALDLRSPSTSLALATGCAVLGRGAPVGEAIERASRQLEDARGVLKIDTVTAGFVEGRFELSPTTHGVIVEGERGASEDQHTLLGKPTRCVGRERELAIVDGFFAECVENSVLRIVLFTAEAGLGKSRLAREAMSRLTVRGASVLVARAEPVTDTVPFALLADAVSRAAGFVRADDARARHAKLAALVGTAGAELLGEIAGAPARAPSELLIAARENPSFMFAQLRGAVAAWLSAVARAPLVIVVDDLQWADPSSLTLLDVVLRDLATCPVLVLGLARPSLFEHMPELWRSSSPHVLRLDPLSARAGDRLVREALGADVDTEVVRSLVARSGGNPLFLEELVRAVGSDQVTAVPLGIVATLQLRFDALAADVRLVLRAASIYGQHFYEDGVAAIVPGVAVDRAIASLLRAELVHPAGDGFAFRHALVRDAAYRLLADDDRAIAHELAARFLERDASPAVVAHHYELGREPMRAAPWWDRAAVHALGLHDLAGARQHVARAVALRDEHSGTSALVLAEAAFWQSDLTGSLAAAHVARARLAPDSVDWLVATGIAITSSGQLGDNEGVAVLLEELLPRDPVAGGLSSYVSALARAVKQLVWAERLDPVRRALARIEQLGDREPLATSAIALQSAARGYLAYCDLDVDEVFAAFHRAAELYERMGAVRDALQCEMLLALFRGELADDPACARAELERIVERARTIEALYLEEWGRFEVGLLVHRAGHHADGRALMNGVSAVVRDATVFRMARLAAECLACRGDEHHHVRDALAPVLGLDLAPSYAAIRDGARAMLARVEGHHAAAVRSAIDALTAFATVADGKLEVRIGVLVASETLAAVAPEQCAALVSPHIARVRASIARVADPARRTAYARVPWNVRLLALDASAGPTLPAR